MTTEGQQEKTPAESGHQWDPALSVPSRTLPSRLLSPGEAPNLKEEGAGSRLLDKAMIRLWIWESAADATGGWGYLGNSGNCRLPGLPG